MITEQVADTVTLYDFEPDTATMREDVLRGLRANPKRLPSQYLYDDRGAELFEGICETPEYYITRTEIGILRQHGAAIADRIGKGALIIEPGSGSGVKTNILIDSLDDPAGYVPIDVARQQLTEFALRMDEEFAKLEVIPVCADFTGDYHVPPCDEAQRRIAYFPGSTIGNFTPDNAIKLLQHFADLCESDGGLLVGVDLKKDRAILEPAYNDAAGVSRDFALNYLRRLNNELNADFDLDRFNYKAPFNEVHGRIEMALVSLATQTVHLDDAVIEFQRNERIGTEFSYKYDLDEFAALAELAGLKVDQVWTDPARFFSIQFLTPQ